MRVYCSEMNAVCWKKVSRDGGGVEKSLKYAILSRFEAVER